MSAVTEDPAPPASPARTATVILPTYRRPAGLRRALAALAVQEDPGVVWDVVVIDNDDAPGVEDAYREARESLAVPARFVREPRRGSAHARNRGIEEATGDVTAMLDDDVVPAKDWLRVLLAPIVAGRCDGTGGRAELDPTVARPRWFHEEPLGAYLGSWDLGGDERPLRAKEFLITSNCALVTRIVRASGGFDPRLGPRGRTPLVNDDALLTRRFAAAGGRLHWVPGALVVHDLPPERLNRRYLLKRAFAQGRSDWILDRDEMEARRFRGARVWLSWLRKEIGYRRAEGLRRPEVAFHLALDLVRTTGAITEGASRRGDG